MGRIVQKYEWVSILNTMKRYNRLDGYVNDVEDCLIFFDSDAIIDDCHSFHVTIQEVEDFVKNYDNK